MMCCHSCSGRKHKDKEHKLHEEPEEAKPEEAKPEEVVEEDFVAPGDNKLYVYMEEVRERIQPLPSTRDQVVALAQ